MLIFSGFLKMNKIYIDFFNSMNIQYPNIVFTLEKQIDYNLCFLKIF